MRMRAALSAFALGATTLAAACEPRVEEPAPPPRQVDLRPVNEAPTAKKQGSDATPPGSKSRCVRPTSAEPLRKTPPSPDPRCPPDPQTPPKLASGKVSFPGAAGRAVTVEIAEKDEDRQRGLMYRKSMPEEQGMLFVFQERADHAFWMHNTCIPLDMLYIDEDGFIVGIEENTPTMSDQTFDVRCPSKYVLELNAGYTRRHGIQAGQWVKIER